jgi:3'-phosphoadenosine 5'-phosphosulfate sulfotransferase (PAPS reductase)/FAD synthetase
MIISWWSGGITSAVACKKALELYPNVKLVFIETGSHHPDTQRFKADCEKWYGVSIETLQSTKYKDHFDVIEKDRYINGPTGARCTLMLKRTIREKWTKGQDVTGQVWGFESGKKEEGRAERIKVSIPNMEHYFPLIEAGLSKQDCIDIVIRAGIEVPMMYKLGFTNNNCLGCVKGGMAYWNMTRQHFPEVFDKMAKLERQLGRSCLKAYFLDELPPDAGRGTPPLVTDCGATGEGCMTELSRQYHQRD